jgi:hypothetical protein
MASSFQFGDRVRRLGGREGFVVEPSPRRVCPAGAGSSMHLVVFDRNPYPSWIFDWELTAIDFEGICTAKDNYDDRPR